MDNLRFSLAALFALVAAVSVECALISSPNRMAASISLALTVSVLLFATLCAFLRDGGQRDGGQRAYWIGFALFGWVYLMLVRMEPYVAHPYHVRVLTTELLNTLTGYEHKTENAQRAVPVYLQGQMLHFVFALLFGLIGGLLACVVTARPKQDDKARP